MKPSSVHLVSVAIFGICTAGVWALRGGHGVGTTAPDSHGASSGKASKTSRSGGGKMGMPADVAARLAAVRAERTTGDRLRATIQLAESLPIEDMEKWFTEDWFDGKEDMQSYLFYRIARARWLAADPEGLMSHCLREKSDRTYEVAAVWVDRDPAAALAFAGEIKDPTQRSNFLSQIGGALGKADPQLAFDSISKLAAKLDPNQVSSLSEIVRGIELSSPDFLKGRIDELPLPLRAEALEYQAIATLKQNFHSGVAELEKSRDGKRQFTRAMQRDPELIKEAAKNLHSLPAGWFAEAASNAGYYLVREDPMRWLKEDLAALDFSSQQAENLRSYALGQLSQKDPEQVLSMLAGQDLSGNERSNAISGVVSAMAKDKEKVEAWIATLTDEQDITTAKSALSSHTQNKSGPITPASLIGSLTESGASVSWDQARAANTWGQEERNAVMKEFAALPPEQKEGVAKKFVENHYDAFPSSVRSEAVRYLIENKKVDPELEKRGVPMDSTPLVRAAAMQGSKWAEEDPNAGSRWVNSLPDGPERLWAAANFAARWVEYEPAEARGWIASLPAEERKQVQQFIDSGEASR